MSELEPNKSIETIQRLLQQDAFGRGDVLWHMSSLPTFYTRARHDHSSAGGTLHSLRATTQVDGPAAAAGASQQVPAQASDLRVNPATAAMAPGLGAGTAGSTAGSPSQPGTGPGASKSGTKPRLHTKAALPTGSSSLPSAAGSKKLRRVTTKYGLALVCLNPGVLPPHAQRVPPHARTEAGVDTGGVAKLVKAQVRENLTSAFGALHDKLRMEVLTDPSIRAAQEHLVKIRTRAKEDRVLLLYNGHGVPDVTSNSDLYLFNDNITEYVPITLESLMLVSQPAILIFDCSNAGYLVDRVPRAPAWPYLLDPACEDASLVGVLPDAGQRGRVGGVPVDPMRREWLALGATRGGELLPVHPDLPADLFTTCLTYPAKAALHWYASCNPLVVPPNVVESVQSLPGQETDRKSPLGQLQWVLTAITDTIAWDALPRGMFLHLFRQDMVVACLYRNFLVAQRIMRYYGATPVCQPRLPARLWEHPLWAAWDLAVERTLVLLPALVRGSGELSPPASGPASPTKPPGASSAPLAGPSTERGASRPPAAHGSARPLAMPDNSHPLAAARARLSRVNLAETPRAMSSHMSVVSSRVGELIDPVDDPNEAMTEGRSGAARFFDEQLRALTQWIQHMRRLRGQGITAAAALPAHLPGLNSGLFSALRAADGQGGTVRMPGAPVLLQSLLSTVLRQSALRLLVLATSLGRDVTQDIAAVGVKPYITTLLSKSKSPSQTPLLLFVWAALLRADPSARQDVATSEIIKAFISSLGPSVQHGANLQQLAPIIKDPRVYAALCLCTLLQGHEQSQTTAVRCGLMKVLALRMPGPAVTSLASSRSKPPTQGGAGHGSAHATPSPDAAAAAASAAPVTESLVYRLWLCLLAGAAVAGSNDGRVAAWVGPLPDLLLPLLIDGAPRVRAAATLALGNLLRSGASGVTQPGEEQTDDDAGSSYAYQLLASKVSQQCRNAEHAAATERPRVMDPWDTVEDAAYAKAAVAFGVDTQNQAVTSLLSVLRRRASGAAAAAAEDKTAATCTPLHMEFALQFSIHALTCAFLPSTVHASFHPAGVPVPPPQPTPFPPQPPRPRRTRAETAELVLSGQSAAVEMTGAAGGWSGPGPEDPHSLHARPSGPPSMPSLTGAAPASMMLAAIGSSADVTPKLRPHRAPHVPALDMPPTVLESSEQETPGGLDTASIRSSRSVEGTHVAESIRENDVPSRALLLQALLGQTAGSGHPAVPMERFSSSGSSDGEDEQSPPHAGAQVSHLQAPAVQPNVGRLGEPPAALRVAIPQAAQFPALLSPAASELATPETAGHAWSHVGHAAGAGGGGGGASMSRVFSGICRTPSSQTLAAGRIASSSTTGYTPMPPTLPPGPGTAPAGPGVEAVEAARHLRPASERAQGAPLALRELSIASSLLLPLADASVLVRREAVLGLARFVSSEPHLQGMTIVGALYWRTLLRDKLDRELTTRGASAGDGFAGDPGFVPGSEPTSTRGSTGLSTPASRGAAAAIGGSWDWERLFQDVLRNAVDAWTSMLAATQESEQQDEPGAGGDSTPARRASMSERPGFSMVEVFDSDTLTAKALLGAPGVLYTSILRALLTASVDSDMTVASTALHSVCRITLAVQDAIMEVHSSRMDGAASEPGTPPQSRAGEQGGNPSSADRLGSLRGAGKLGLGAQVARGTPGRGIAGPGRHVDRTRLGLIKALRLVDARSAVRAPGPACVLMAAHLPRAFNSHSLPPRLLPLDDAHMRTLRQPPATLGFASSLLEQCMVECEPGADTVRAARQARQALQLVDHQRSLRAKLLEGTALAATVWQNALDVVDAAVQYVTVDVTERARNAQQSAQQMQVLREEARAWRQRQHASRATAEDSVGPRSRHVHMSPARGPVADARLQVVPPTPGRAGPMRVSAQTLACMSAGPEMYRAGHPDATYPGSPTRHTPLARCDSDGSVSTSAGGSGSAGLPQLHVANSPIEFLSAAQTMPPAQPQPAGPRVPVQLLANVQTQTLASARSYNSKLACKSVLQTHDTGNSLVLFHPVTSMLITGGVTDRLTMWDVHSGCPIGAWSTAPGIPVPALTAAELGQSTVAADMEQAVAKRPASRKYRHRWNRMLPLPLLPSPTIQAQVNARGGAVPKLCSPQPGHGHDPGTPGSTRSSKMGLPTMPDSAMQLSYVMSACWLNEHADPLLMTANSQGVVQIWRDLVPAESAWALGRDGKVLGDASADGVGAAHAGPDGSGAGAGRMRAASVSGYGSTESVGGPGSTAGSTASAGLGRHMPELVSTWRALPDQSARTAEKGSMTQVHWEPASGRIAVGGNSQFVRLWDAATEQCVGVIPVGVEASVSSIAGAWPGTGVLVAGKSNGTVTVLDTRMPPHLAAMMGLTEAVGPGSRTQVVRRHREHRGYVLKVAQPRSAPGHVLLSASTHGDLKIWDLRKSGAVYTEQVARDGLTAMAVHDWAPVVALGCRDHRIQLLQADSTGIVNAFESGAAGRPPKLQSLSEIKFHEGFLGQRIDLVIALAFHPHSMALASGGVGPYVAVHASASS